MTRTYAEQTKAIVDYYDEFTGKLPKDDLQHVPEPHRALTQACRIHVNRKWGKFLNSANRN